MASRIEVVDDLAESALAAFKVSVGEAIAARGRCTVALSGGSTPKALYERLQPDDLPWDKVELFFGDERRVPLDDALSNYHMVARALLSRIDVTAHPLAHAAAYDALLRDRLGRDGAFDVMLLGMGDDGHTASIFPGSPALNERQRWVMDAPGVAPAPRRFTVTPRVIQAARRIYVLVGGSGKAEMLHNVLEGPRGVYPSQIALDVEGEAIWMLDKPAAARLSGL